MNLIQVVEKLGRVKADIGAMTAEEQSLKAMLIHAAAQDVRDAVVEGPLFRSTVSFTDRKVVNWQGALEAICEEYGVSGRELATVVARYTNKVEGLPCVRVTARKAA